MNAFNLKEIQDEPLLESCDKCNALIPNWETLTNSFITLDGKVCCKQCVETP